MTPLHAIQTHRRQQASAGWPILNAIPSTFVVQRLNYLESLSKSDVDALLDAWEAYDRDAEETGKDPSTARAAIDRFPALAAYISDAQATEDRRSASTLSVKLIAGVLQEPGLNTLEDWAAYLHMPPGAARLRPPLACSIDDLVPVPPRTLRSGLKRMLKARFGAESVRIGADHTRFEGSQGGCRVVVDALFAAGWSKMTRQVDPHLSVVSPEGSVTLAGGYEALWAIPVQWDYLTVENCERSLTLLGDIIVLLSGLAQGRAGAPLETPA